jgi:nucleotide-binding universal stress UspA family protein
MRQDRAPDHDAARTRQMPKPPSDPTPTGDDGPVLIAYDGSDPARHAIAQAGRLFAGRPARVVTAWSSMRDAARAGRAALPADVIAEAIRNLDAVAEQNATALAEEGAAAARDAGLDATAESVRGDPSVPASLIRLADEHRSPAVVMGSRGRSALKSALLGSVSNTVVQHSRRPVMIVHPPGDEQP